jgi:hypothetical protein
MAVSRKTAAAASVRRSPAAPEFADHWELSDLVTDPVAQFRPLSERLEREGLTLRIGSRRTDCHYAGTGLPESPDPLGTDREGFRPARSLRVLVVFRGHENSSRPGRSKPKWKNISLPSKTICCSSIYGGRAWINGMRNA